MREITFQTHGSFLDRSVHVTYGVMVTDWDIVWTVSDRSSRVLISASLSFVEGFSLSSHRTHRVVVRGPHGRRERVFVQTGICHQVIPHPSLGGGADRSTRHPCGKSSSYLTCHRTPSLTEHEQPSFRRILRGLSSIGTSTVG